MTMRAITVKDYMTASLVTLDPDMALLDAVHALVSNRIAGAPVVDQTGELVGMLSEKDCLKMALQSGYHGGTDGQVRELMSTRVETVEAQTSIIELAQRFMDNPYRRYPVTDGTRLVGIISRRDVLRALLKR
jgi:CBS domain-containing protein